MTPPGVDMLGIEAISVFGLPPIDHVNLAADLGCQCISTGLTAYPYNPHGYPDFSLRDDPALRREMRAVLRDRSVVISLGEGLTVRPGRDVRAYERDLDIFVELGAVRINTVSMDPDENRTFDQWAVLAELAGTRGLMTTTEFAPGLAVADLATALRAVRHVDRGDFTLLIDTMHLVRSGSCARQIAALDPRLIGYVQLCDAPRTPRFASYFEESMFERLAPGDGELGLEDIVAALPDGLVFGLEVPMRGAAEAGIGPSERLRRCVEGARKLLARTGHSIENKATI